MKILKVNIQRSYIMLLGIVTLLLLGTYYSYALFTVRSEEKKAIQIVTGSLYSKLSDNSNKIAMYASSRITPNSKKTFLIQPNEEKTVELKIENINNRPAKFNLYYQASTLKDVAVGYLENSEVPLKEGFVIEKDSQKDFKIRIYNQGTEPVEISFGSDVGLENKPLNFREDAYVIEAYQPIDGSAIKELLDKANKISQYEENTEKELYPLKMSLQNQEAEKEEIVDYRYIGNQPNNHVLFQNEQYRIVGIFETKDEYGTSQKRIKLVKESPLKTSRYQEEEKNSYDESLIKGLLDDEFYKNLDENSKNLIAKVEWAVADLKDGTVSNLYQQERIKEGNSTYLYNISLLYPSDYLYSYALNFNQNCFRENKLCNNGWLGEMIQGSSFLLSYNTKVNNEYTAVSITSNKNLDFLSSLLEEREVYPSFYLKSNVKVAGDGTEENPYQFSI